MHGHARVSVRVRREGDVLLIAIADDGRGAARTPAPHLGLLGMNERIVELGGSLELESTRPTGTVFVVRVPVGRKETS